MGAAQQRRLKVVPFPDLNLQEVVEPWLAGELELNVMYLYKEGFGDYLKRLRRVRGVTSREVAERMGISQAQYSRVETTPPQRNPTEDFVKGVSEALGVDIREMLDRAGFMVLVPDTDALATLRPEDRLFEDILLQPELQPSGLIEAQVKMFSDHARGLIIDLVKNVLSHERSGGTFDFETDE